MNPTPDPIPIARKPRVMVVYGTRPEGIKIAPLVSAVSESTALGTPIVVTTGQHREMLRQVHEVFGLAPDHDLDLQTDRQTLESLSAALLLALPAIFDQERPDAVVVQGDTTSAAVAALAAFYQRIPVIHLEAGLRTGNPFNPFPEETNRRLVSTIASLHLAPTPTNRDNLLREGIDPDTIAVTGNTGIDALKTVVAKRLTPTDRALTALPEGPMVLVTTHRRESLGEPMVRCARAISTLAAARPDTTFLLPAHPNPAVREVLLPHVRHHANVVITEPLGYVDFTWALERSTVVLTDSGGVQEEAPSLGKPVFVMRETTERPEAVSAGTVELVGTDEALIVARVSECLGDSAIRQERARRINPYGDGRAAARAVAAIEQFFGLGVRMADFEGSVAKRHLHARGA